MKKAQNFLYNRLKNKEKLDIFPFSFYHPFAQFFSFCRSKFKATIRIWLAAIDLYDFVIGEMLRSKTFCDLHKIINGYIVVRQNFLFFYIQTQSECRTLEFCKQLNVIFQIIFIRIKRNLASYFISTMRTSLEKNTYGIRMHTIERGILL